MPPRLSVKSIPRVGFLACSRGIFVVSGAKPQTVGNGLFPSIA